MAPAPSPGANNRYLMPDALTPCPPLVFFSGSCKSETGLSGSIFLQIRDQPRVDRLLHIRDHQVFALENPRPSAILSALAIEKEEAS